MAVLPLAPSITIARAEEMLKGEKKIFPVLSSSFSFSNKAREKVAFALDTRSGDAIGSGMKKGGRSMNHYTTNFILHSFV